MSTDHKPGEVTLRRAETVAQAIITHADAVQELVQALVAYVRALTETREPSREELRIRLIGAVDAHLMEHGFYLGGDTTQKIGAIVDVVLTALAAQPEEGS